MNMLRASCVLAATMLLLLPTISQAQYEVSAQDEYAKRLKSYETIQAQGDSPFGEQVSLYTGAMTLRQTDIALEGMGPTISLVRATASDLAETDISEPNAFGNWTLSIPRIETLIDSTVGWEVEGTSDADALKRCTRFDRPVYTVFNTSNEGWHGIDLITETGERQQLLKRGSQNTIAPVMTNASGMQLAFPALTNGNWQIGCLDAIQNSTGEGFFVVSPNGTKYWFNRLETDGANTMLEDAGWGVTLKQRRALATMYVTRIEDRFGNYLVYEFGGDDKLDRITASDGREVSIVWRTDQYRLIDSITMQPALGPARTWRYHYGNFSSVQIGLQTVRSAVLLEVELPDATRWTFDLQGVGGGGLIDYSNSTCGTRTHANGTGGVVTTIKHPNGLVGKFTFQATWHGQSYVSSSCRRPTQPGEEFEPFEETPPLFGTMSLTRKEISGPGLPTKEWTYTYEPAQGSTTEDPCAATGTCASTKWVNVVDPADDRTTYIYVNRSGGTEGQLLRVHRYEGTSSPIRTDVYTYAVANEGPWPAFLGSPLAEGNGRSSGWMPLKKKVIEQQGKQFIWEALAFDGYANPTKVKRYSNLDASFTRTEDTEYLYNVSLWVIGQVKKLTDVTIPESPVVIQETIFDAATALPLSTYSFGQLKQSFTHYAEGVLKTVKDALTRTYTFTAYKRGIAQRIDFPDNTYIAATVDDYGQITSVRDQLNNTTSYTFDVMGRLDTTTPPPGWTGSDVDFVSVGGVEFGIAAGHWRRTLTKGNARSITYFDAEWRPILTHDYDYASPGVTSRYVAHGYDAFGRQSFASFPVKTAPTWTPGGWTLGGTPMLGTRTSYDALGRPLQSIQNTELPGADALATTTYAYPSGGLKVQVTDARNATTATTFQAFDTPKTNAPVLIEMPLGVITNLVRDRHGKTLSITRSGPATTPVTRLYYYDASQRLCRLKEPETGSTVTAYDAAENVTWSASGMNITGTDCGHEQVASTQRVVRGYDTMNRVRTIDYPPGTDDVSYDYDAGGNVISATNAANINWTYGPRNALGLPTSETLSIDGFTYALRYNYTPLGHLKTLTYPDDRVVDFAPNALGQPTQASSYATSVGFFPDGNVEFYRYGNGIEYLAQKHKRGLPSNLTYSSGTALLYSQDLTYDVNANLRNVTDLSPVAPSRTKTMEYDLLNRLTKSVAPGLWSTEIYEYDALDNIQSITRNGVNNLFEYDTLNRLTRIANAATSQTLHSYAYDSRGNATTRDGATLTFDEANRLMSISGKGGYKYDAWARRVKRSNAAGAGQSYYLYSQAGQLLFEHDLTTNKLTDYVLLGGKLVAKVAADTPVPAIQAPGLSTNGTYTVTWTAVSGATSYALEEAANGGAWITVYSGGNLLRSYSSKPHGSYAYRVKACFSFGCGNVSPVATVTVDLRPQSAPTLTAPSYNPSSNYTVSWTAVGTATTYEVQTSGSSWVWGAFYNGANLSQAVTGQTPGQYNYRGRACNTYGCGPWSASVSTSVELPPNSAPSLSAPSQSFTGSYGVSWTAIGGVTSYTLEQSANGGTWTTVQANAALSWSTSGQPAGSYAYRAKACNPAGCGGYSTTVTVTVVYPPTSTSSVTAPASTITGNFNVSWTAVASATYYNLERKLGSGAWGGIYSGSALAMTQTLAVDGSYGYRVQGCNVAGCGPWSATTTTAVEVTPVMPSDLVVVVTVDDIVRPPLIDWDVTWSTSAGATRYDLQIQNGTYAPTVSNVGLATQYHLEGRGTRTFWVRACKGAANCSGWRDTTNVINQ